MRKIFAIIVRFFCFEKNFKKVKVWIIVRAFFIQVHGPVFVSESLVVGG